MIDRLGVEDSEVSRDANFTEDLDASDFLDDEIASATSDDDTFGL